jgi:hypothetical protein
LHADFVGQGKQDYTRLLEERAPDLKIVRMEKHMPTERGRDDVYKWFNLPHDGHFSNYGVEIYAAAVQRALHEYTSPGSEDPQRVPAVAGAADETKLRRE